MSKLFYLFLLFLWISSCSKEAGDGGFAKIQGKVFAYNLNKTKVIADSGYIGDQRVFISYGDHTVIDDETRTSYTGEFQFKNLNQGDYTIFTFSYCDACPLNEKAIMVKTTIKSKKELVQLSDLKIFKE
ncbi:MAG TPA: hypothetical protein PK006_11040 [Saprospiraceae bacterium]|nr:hypothetical protein [Saprospiraceae bacterium]